MPDDLIDQLMRLDRPALRSALSGALGSLSGKATKAEANYRKADDDSAGRNEPDTPRECGGCVHFTKSAGTVDGACDEVAGTIFHEYVCDYFDDAPDDGEGDDNRQNGDSASQEGHDNERGYSDSRGGRSRDRSPLDP